MEHVIVFTPAQIITFCAALITLSGALSVILKAISKVKEPNDVQNTRLDAHDEHLKELDRRLEAHEKFFKQDKERFEDLEASNRVSQKALLALLGHSINGNNITQLEDAQRDLEKYLLEK